MLYQKHCLNNVKKLILNIELFYFYLMRPKKQNRTSKYKTKVTFFFALFATMVFVSCSSDRYIRIQFDPVAPVVDSAWIKIDDITFIHSPHDFEWSTIKVFPEENGDGYYGYLPTSRVFFYHPNNKEKRVMERKSSFEICKKLGRHLSQIKEDDKMVYQIINPNEYLATGVLKIIRRDGKPISVSVSSDNPVLVQSIKQRSQ